MTAEKMFRQIQQNVADYFADEITHHQFTIRQRETWDEITAAGQTEAVAAMIRADIDHSKIRIETTGGPA